MLNETEVQNVSAYYNYLGIFPKILVLESHTQNHWSGVDWASVLFNISGGDSTNSIGWKLLKRSKEKWVTVSYVLYSNVSLGWFQRQVTHERKITTYAHQNPQSILDQNYLRVFDMCHVLNLHLMFSSK